MRGKYSKQKYNKLYFISLCGYVASTAILALASESVSKILYPITLLPFTVLMVYAAYINSKLPPQERKQVSYGLSIFSIHPYVTVFLLVIFAVLAFIECYML